jgi:hypothetical protein
VVPFFLDEYAITMSMSMDFSVFSILLPGCRNRYCIKSLRGRVPGAGRFMQPAHKVDL